MNRSAESWWSLSASIPSEDLASNDSLIYGKAQAGKSLEFDGFSQQKEPPYGLDIGSQLAKFDDQRVNLHFGWLKPTFFG